MERITDSSMQVVTADRKSRYHIECQSTPNQSILIRLFEYDSQIALDYGSLEENCLVVEFPRSALIYLRSNEKTPDEMTIEIRTSDGQSIRHRIPVMKLNCYGMDELFEKKLWFLLPFHGFYYEHRFQESETDQDRREELTGIFREMRGRLDELCSSGQMDGYQKYRILSCINMVLQKLMEKYPNTRKEVLDVMGGKVVECEVDWILQRGIEQGREQGLAQGREQGLAQGREQGLAQGRELGLAQGRELGLAQGKELGLAQGKELGLAQGRSQMIENLLNRNKTPEEIAEFCGFEIKEIENVQKRMLVNT